MSHYVAQSFGSLPRRPGLLSKWGRDVKGSFARQQWEDGLPIANTPGVRLYPTWSYFVISRLSIVPTSTDTWPAVFIALTTHKRGYELDAARKGLLLRLQCTVSKRPSLTVNTGEESKEVSVRGRWPLANVFSMPSSP